MKNYINKLAMAIRRSAVAAAILAGVLGADALDVKVDAPGTLSRAVGDLTSETTLKIVGAVDAADLYFIGKEMTALTDLDMSQATIADYSGRPVEGRTIYKAGEIPPAAFAGLSLTRFVFPTVTPVTIGDGAFAGTKLTNITLPANVTSIGAGAFAGCYNLVSIHLGNLKELSPSAFSDCVMLKEIDGSAAVEVIGDGALKGCTALTEFDFGRNLTEIGEGAFARTGLTAADMGGCKILRRLGSGAFADCQSLESVRLPWVLEETGEGTFLGDKLLESILIPAGVAEIGPGMLAATGLKEGGLGLSEGIEKIGDYSLAAVGNLTEIILPETLEEIGDGAMQSMTGLKEIRAVYPPAPARLGENVWSGVDQSDVTLLTDESLVSAYSSLEQWKEFKIKGTSGVGDIESDRPRTGDIAITLDGGIMTVKSSDSAISSVRLHDIAGRLIVSVTPNAAEVTLGVGETGEPVMIVIVELEDGTTAAQKISRT